MSISVQNLTKRYGPLAVVDDISFQVATGEFVSLLGPSGCGKTTTLRCIAGLEEANAGMIRIGDSPVSAPASKVMIPPDQRDVGMVFQSYAIWPHMSVEANVGFPLAIRGVAAEEVRREAERALDIVALRHLKDRQPSQLSGGQQQRVALARAIVGKPKILLFDEPLSNLDAKLREGTRSEIRRLQRELGVAAIYVTHDQTEALSMSDRVIVMNAGRIVQEGTPKDLYRRPVDRFVADFVGHASFIDLQRDGDSWKTRDGTRIMVAEPHGRPGERSQAMLRPESIRLADKSTAEAVDRENTLRGRIDESHYMGAYTEYLIEAGGALLKVHASADMEPGQEVMLSFRREDCRLVNVG